MTENRQMLVASLPTGALSETDFELVDRPLPSAGDGEVLVRTLAITIGAGQRAGLQGSASYAGPARTGVVMTGTGVGRVEVSNVADVAVGDLVVGPTGWQDYAVLRGREITKVVGDADPAHYLGVLGTNGLTAYFGLLAVGQPTTGDTVVVSAAAGSVGHIVGQIAKIQGCRVVGLTSSESKGRVLTDELGFDAVVNYRSADFRDAFKVATADGIDIYFDNTGGDILGACLRRMKVHGRIVCCGVVSQYDTSNPEPGPRGIPGLLVNNRVRMEGFLVFDFLDRYEEARNQMRQWLADGRLQARSDTFEGLEQAPRAFVDLLAGGNIGTRVVTIAD